MCVQQKNKKNYVSKFSLKVNKEEGEENKKKSINVHKYKKIIKINNYKYY